MHPLRSNHEEVRPVTRSAKVSDREFALSRPLRQKALPALWFAVALLLCFFLTGGAPARAEDPPADPGTAEREAATAPADEEATAAETPAEDATSVFLGLSGEFESEEARKAKREEAERYANVSFPPATRVVRLSLREAIEAALAYNLDIVVERFNPLLLDRDVVSAKALLHDPIFDSSIEYTTRNTPIASIFFPSGAISERITEYSFGISQPTTIGGLVRAELRTIRTDTNSPIATLVDTFEPVLVLSISQNLLKGFGWNVNRIILRRSQIAESQSIELLRQQVINSVFAVEEAYWRLVQARETLKVERLGLRLAEDLLRQNQIQVKVGTMAPLDVLQAKAQMKAQETAVIVAENAVRQAQNLLLRLTTGDNELLTQDVRVETTDSPDFTPASVDFLKNLRTALERRPDLRGAALAVQNRDLLKKGARNNLLPKAELIFSTGFQGLSGDPNGAINPFSGSAPFSLPVLDAGGVPVAPPESVLIPGAPSIPSGAGVVGTPFAGQTSFNDATGTFFSNDEFSFWSVGIFVSYPIGNRDARAQYARSKLALEKSEKDLTRAEQLATLDVRRVIDALDASARAVESTREAREVSEEQLEAEEKKLAVGFSTNFEVLEFQRNLTDRRREEIQALTQHKISRVDLSRATGTILDDLNIEFLEE